MIWFSPRNKTAILDVSKVADVLIFVCSPNPKINMGKLNFDLGFYDEVPEIFKLLKSQGIPYVIPIIQGSYKLNKKQKNILLKAYKYYFTSEFSNSNNIFPVDDFRQLVRVWNFVSLKKHFKADWRHRSFLLAQSTKFHKNIKGNLNFQVIGYLRGDKSLNINQLIHLTGLGDFHITRIEVKNSSNYRKNLTNNFYHNKNNFLILEIKKGKENKKISKNTEQTNRKISNLTDLSPALKAKKKQVNRKF